MFNVSATEYQPWLGNAYEFEARGETLYQGFATLASDGDHKKYLCNDFFLNFSLINSIPDPSFGIELEVTGALTRKQHGEVDQLKFTGRYVWQDDIMGDPLSMITGASYIQAFEHSLKDLSSFHHGLYNIECFVSVGRESSDETRWGSRWWGMFGLGIAEKGSAWFRLRFDYDKRFNQKHEIGLFIEGLCGLGHKHLEIKKFEGYGAVKHQSVDAGLRYVYVLDYCGNASLEYCYRLYANNFPAYTHRVVAQFLYPFGW